MRPRASLLAGAGLLTVLMACRGSTGGQQGVLRIHFLLPPSPAPDPFAGLASYRLTLWQGSAAVVSQTFGPGEPITLGPLDPRTGVVLSLEGLSGSGGTFSRGRTAPVDLTTGDTSATMYFARVGVFNPVSGSYLPRIAPSVAALSDGRVLIAGGILVVPVTHSDLYDPTTDTLSPTADLPVAHGFPATISLDGNDVLVAGGAAVTGTAMDRADVFVYAPATHSGSWAAAVPPMTAARRDLSGVALGSGNAVVAGGSNGTGALSSTDVFHWSGSEGSWIPGPDLAAQRRGALAIPLGPGQAILGGGVDSSGASDDAALLYTWSSGGGIIQDNGWKFTTDRGWSAVIAGPPGSWLVVGGLNDKTGPLAPTAASEWDSWDGSTFSVQALPSVTPAHRRGGGALVPGVGGVIPQVLSLGGDTASLDPGAALDLCLLYDPASGGYLPAASSPGPTIGAGVVPLADGTLLVVTDAGVTRYQP